MKRAGMPLTTVAKITCSEILPKQRIAYVNLADFIPGVAAYDVATSVDLFASPQGVRMLMTFDAMHAASWTERMLGWWTEEVGKLKKVLEVTHARSNPT